MEQLPYGGEPARRAGGRGGDLDGPGQPVAVGDGVGPVPLTARQQHSGRLGQQAQQQRYGDDGREHARPEDPAPARGRGERQAEAGRRHASEVVRRHEQAGGQGGPARRRELQDHGEAQRHEPAQAETGDEASGAEHADAVGQGAQGGPGGEQAHAGHEHQPAAEPVGEVPGGERADEHAERGPAADGARGVRGQSEAGVVEHVRHDGAVDVDVHAVEEHGQPAQGQDREHGAEGVRGTGSGGVRERDICVLGVVGSVSSVELVRVVRWVKIPSSSTGHESLAGAAGCQRCCNGFWTGRSCAATAPAAGGAASAEGARAALRHRGQRGRRTRAGRDHAADPADPGR